jgi:hypothetical protein
MGALSVLSILFGRKITNSPVVSAFLESALWSVPSQLGGSAVSRPR